MKTITITREDWIEEAKKRYGEFGKVAFRCPICSYVATADDYIAAKAEDGAIGYSCIGRFIGAKREAFGRGHQGEGPCNYAGGGLFKMNPVHITQNGQPWIEVFDFADDPLCKE